MLKKLILSWVLLSLLSVPALAGTFYGNTGLIFVPDADAVAPKQIEAGLHITSGGALISLNVGVYKQIEAGLYTLVDHANLGYTLKGVLNPESASFPGVAIGIDSGDVYIVLSRTFDQLRGTLGFGNGGYNGIFGGVSYQLNPITIGSLQPAPLLMLDYNGHMLNGGVRMDILPQLDVDLSLVDFRHAVLGLTYKVQF